MRRKVIAGNWKMNKVQTEAHEFIDNVVHLEKNEQVTAIVCAPFPYLTDLVNKTKGTALEVGAQTMHFEESGAYTGEVSPVMLKDIGVTYVIIGHSERREYFAETDEIVQKKTKAALQHGLTPIVCVGETLKQREAGEAKAHVEVQVKKALDDLTNDQIANVMIAYEPIWAIGTGKTASSEDANEMCAHIRQVVKEVSSAEVSERVIIQYGGSVKPENIDELLAQSDIDGALVGGASLKADSFLQLVEAGAK